jgi:hypothetical protein
VLKIFELKHLNVLVADRTAARLDLVKAENQLMRNAIAHAELHRLAAQARTKIERCDVALDATLKAEREKAKRFH